MTATAIEGTTGAEAASGAALLEVDELTVRFPRSGGEVYAVNGLSYRVEAGKTLAIIGESGSGKTVSSRAIMGLLPPTAKIGGSIRFRGQELVGLPAKQMRHHRGPDLAMVFQDPARSLDPTMRIGTQITEAIRAHLPLGKAEAHERAVELLRMVRVSAPGERFFSYPHQLSGGMRQRVMIAVALACDPALLIADEATTALDVTTQAQIMNLLRDLQRQLGMAIVMISHDLGLAASYADEVIVMYAGRSVERAATAELFANVRMPYTAALLDAVPKMNRPIHARLPAIGGRPPDLSRQPPGCPFAPRCPAVQDKCRTDAPTFLEHEPSHWWSCWYPYAGTTGSAGAAGAAAVSEAAGAADGAETGAAETSAAPEETGAAGPSEGVRP